MAMDIQSTFAEIKKLSPLPLLEKKLNLITRTMRMTDLRIMTVRGIFTLIVEILPVLLVV